VLCDEYFASGVPFHFSPRACCANNSSGWTRHALCRVGLEVEWVSAPARRCAYGGDPRGEIAVMFDDRRRLEDRVYRVSTGFAWSQAPSSRTARIVPNVEVFASPRGDQRMVRSNFVIHDFWDDETRQAAAMAGLGVVASHDIKEGSVG